MTFDVARHNDTKYAAPPPWNQWDSYANCWICNSCGAAAGFQVHNTGCRHVDARWTAMQTANERSKGWHRRSLNAMRDGGRMPSEEEWDAYLDKARGRARQRNQRLRRTLLDPPVAPSVDDFVPLEILAPDAIAVHTDHLLGLEAELCQARADRDRLESMRIETQIMMARAREATACEDSDLVMLETALTTGMGMPRDGEAKLLAAVRELMRWHGAMGR